MSVEECVLYLQVNYTFMSTFICKPNIFETCDMREQTFSD